MFSVTPQGRPSKPPQDREFGFPEDGFAIVKTMPPDAPGTHKFEVCLKFGHMKWNPRKAWNPELNQTKADSKSLTLLGIDQTVEKLKVWLTERIDYPDEQT